MIASLIAACAGGGLMGNSAQDVGARPTDTPALVAAVLRDILKDPYSVRDLEVGAPFQASCAIGIYGRFHGWAVPVTYNAKNSYGAYVGLRDYYFWFHGNAYRGNSRDVLYCSDAGGWLRK